jgi:hypothetical protein
MRREQAFPRSAALPDAAEQLFTTRSELNKGKRIKEKE